MNANKGCFTCIFTTIILGILFFCRQSNASVQIPDEFWISTNATGNFYTNGVGVTGGTIDNPLDGSTEANFDRNMFDLIGDRSLGHNRTIHILAGVYQTKGNNTSGGGYKIGTDNVKIQGAGIDITVLKLVSDPAAPEAFVIGTADVPPYTNIDVSDLTLDANYSGGNFNCFGIGLQGQHNSIRYVKVIDCASFSGSPGDTWGIVMNNIGPGNLIENCEISHFKGGVIGMSSIAFNGGGGGIIRNNHVYLSPTNEGFGIGASENTLIEGNYVDGGVVGVYGDTGNTANLTVINNTFKNVLAGAILANTIRANLTFAFNYLELTNSKGIPSAFFLQNAGTYTNVFIFGNTVRDTSSEGGYFILANNTTGLDVANNHVDSVLTNQYYNCFGVNIDNNYDLYGSYRYDMNTPALGGTPVSYYGIALASSPSSSYALTTLGLPNNPAILVTNGSTRPITFNTNLSVNANITIPAGMAYVYNGQNLAYAITGLDDYFFGGAGNFTMTGNENVAVGLHALSSDTTGFWNTAIGVATLQNNTTAYENTAIGGAALATITTGIENTAVGTGTLGHEIVGGANTASGFLALSSNTNGSFNVANGALALYSNLGNYNTADGAQAIYSNTVGSYNIALGIQAGYNLTTGSSNIDIGNIGVSTDNNITRIGMGQSDAFIAGIIHGNGSGLTDITAQQVNAVAATNATIWNSFSITNSAATDWASMSVTASNAIISVHGVTVAILQTNGVLAAPNGIASSQDNQSAATTIASGVYTLNWTNTTSQNVVVYINNLTGSVKYNGASLFPTVNGSAVTVILQPGENISVLATSPFSARYHSF
ncbi:MAG TPA: hypothetical protein VFV23_11490 [Verrucomicrobiae bacterium]|nr:hypothetical protein [Verrucomicrobiae bacterium]